MALIQCPECGKIISEHAEICIGCGCPMRIIESLNDTYASKALGRIINSIHGAPGPILNGLPEEEYLDVLDDNLAVLDHVERAVLEYRTGLSDTISRTYEEIAVALKIAPSDVYVYEATAYEKLRKIPPLFSVFSVMSRYPNKDALEQEALNRGYIPLPVDKKVGIESNNFAFDSCCRKLLDMYHPSSIQVTPIDELRIGRYVCTLLEEENIHTIGDLVGLSNTEVLEFFNGKELWLRRIQNRLSRVNLALRTDYEG